MKKIIIYDTTLRDGTQMEGISLSVEDKLKVTRLLDELGVSFIEGGWPGSNPKDIQFFREVKKLKLKHAEVVPFGATRRAKLPPNEDPNLAALLETGAKTITIFGKSWDMHVERALGIPLEANVELVYDSIAFLRKNKRRVFFDVEHFFDGYKNNKKYALEVLRTAAKAGAEVLILCDTNGGSLPHEISDIVEVARRTVKTPIGIHCHNDSDSAVANSVAAVRAGAVHVQGTINGYGERCGNANLCSIIPNLQMKLGYTCIPAKNLPNLSEVAAHIGEIANVPPSAHQPYVGRSAFAHKGGVHVSAVMKYAATYEHMEPARVGNSRRVTVSELSGVSNILFKAKEFGVDVKQDSPEIRRLLQKLKEMEHLGYQFEEGEASFELLVREAVGDYKPRFELEGFRVDTDMRPGQSLDVEAALRLKVGEKHLHTVGSGDGPVNALDAALRKALEEVYPELATVRLTDYKVRVIDGADGTAAKVRVTIESADAHRAWGTVGVSTNIIEASWKALSDSFQYKLLKLHEDAPKAKS